MIISWKVIEINHIWWVATFQKTGSISRAIQQSPEIIRLAVMMYVRFPLSLRNVEDLLHERGIDISHDTVRFWWNRFGPLFEGDQPKKRRHMEGMRIS
jgi:putative transposase